MYILCIIYFDRHQNIFNFYADLNENSTVAASYDDDDVYLNSRKLQRGVSQKKSYTNMRSARGISKRVNTQIIEETDIAKQPSNI